MTTLRANGGAVFAFAGVRVFARLRTFAGVSALTTLLSAADRQGAAGVSPEPVSLDSRVPSFARRQAVETAAAGVTIATFGWGEGATENGEDRMGTARAEVSAGAAAGALAVAFRDA